MTASWDSYALSDFLLFSEATYWRLFARANAENGAVTLFLLLLSLAAVAALLRGERRAVFAVLALGWLWSGAVFMREFYTPVNWVAGVIWPAFIVQGALLLWLAINAPAPASRTRQRIGGTLAVYAVLLHPLTALAEREIAAAELFGTAPDPTAFFTLAALLTSRAGWPGRLCAALALAWCGASALTLYAMDAWQGAVPMAVAAVFLIAASLARR